MVSPAFDTGLFMTPIYRSARAFESKNSLLFSARWPNVFWPPTCF